MLRINKTRSGTVFWNDVRYPRDAILSIGSVSYLGSLAYIRVISIKYKCSRYLYISPLAGTVRCLMEKCTQQLWKPKLLFFC